ncbi:MAG TPA: dihydrolipoyllysine-residue succinyltransferase [Acidimicrobiaceae bacterium]|jgi:2-oxoglutarate dehydrogenase E2 component (dihydrolipoamide succinyltransferase)|nr:dihydrolipoyllysine-residue succinyltransferase [Actinomycetota bacterium]HAN08307.1 dihydrolipoyllysine-residue succinyltransferase [Acidimicrobiaceae bacterium]
MANETRKVEVLLPQLGETVEEGTITRWFKKPGEYVKVDEVLYEVSTEKVDSEVPSPISGTISEIKVGEGDTVDVGTVLLIIEKQLSQDGVAEIQQNSENDSRVQADKELASVPDNGEDQKQTDVTLKDSSNPTDDLLIVSPLVRKLIRESDLDPLRILGTGVGGRITRRDVLAVIDSRNREDVLISSNELSASVEKSRPQVDSGDNLPFSNIRRRTAEHMLMSVAASPHALTVMEVDYENVDTVRNKLKKEWKEITGSSLTYLPFVMRAVIDALEDWPCLNASVVGDGLRLHKNVNIGIAVDLDHEGLIVPVIKQAGGIRLEALAKLVIELALKARNRQLSADDVHGGTFTISNNGSFGTHTTAAIINQPQVGVLSTDGVTRKPVVVADTFGNESIAIHSVGHLALAWDHRAFDGGYAAGFLRQIKESLETRNWDSEF